MSCYKIPYELIALCWILKVEFQAHFGTKINVQLFSFQNWIWKCHWYHNIAKNYVSFRVLLTCPFPVTWTAQDATSWESQIELGRSSNRRFCSTREKDEKHPPKTWVVSLEGRDLKNLINPTPGARPTNGILIKFEIQPKFAALWFKMYSTNHSKILSWLVEYILNQSSANLGRIWSKYH